METIGYLFSRNGAGIKMHSHPDRERALAAALTQASQWMHFERARPTEVEEMTWSREHGWCITGRVWRFHGPLREAR